MITEGCSARDKYDEAIDILTADPTLIHGAWNVPKYAHGGCLFSYATPSGGHEKVGSGCLTQICYNIDQIVDNRPDLTERIRNDTRIPQNFNITVGDLPVFAEWQRILDKELGRV